MKIICYSSHPAVWSYILLEARVAQALQNLNHEVLFLTPGKSFRDCNLCLSAHGLTSNSDESKKNKVEKLGLLNEDLVRKRFGLKGYDIGAYLTREDWSEINEIIARVDKNNFESLIIENINIGKIGMYEFLLRHKKMDSGVTDAEWDECKVDIRNTLISFFSCRNIIKKENPDRILMYNTLYSANYVWKKYAQSRGVDTYFLHVGPSLADFNGRLIIAKGGPLDFTNETKRKWQMYKKLATPPEMIKYVTDHFLELLKGQHFLAYSAPKSKKLVDIRKIFNIRINQKVLTATMGSYDEVFSSEYIGEWPIPKDIAFVSQTDWIKATIEYVKDHKELFLIIRVHPREFPNKRDGLKSVHAEMLESTFKNLPDNVRVNWPTDNISIYDLAQETDVFLNSWSSVGMEMSLLGLPVVVYADSIIFYPSDINYLAKTRSEYFSVIEHALSVGWSFEKIKTTYRWMALFYYRSGMLMNKNSGSLKISDQAGINTGFYRNIYDLLPKSLKSYVKMKILLSGKMQDKVSCERMGETLPIEKLEKMLHNSWGSLIDEGSDMLYKITDKEEELSIRSELGRIYRGLYGEQTDDMALKPNSLQYYLKQNSN